MKLEGKVAVLTGGEGPLGRAVTKKFLAEGAKVVVAWYAQDEWKEAKSLIGDYRGQFVDMQIDATKEEQVEQLMNKARESFGSLDVLLHMVGMFQAGGMLWETDTAILERLFEVNLKSAFLCSKYAARVMLETGHGRIVVFPAKLAIEPQPGMGAYSISKSGLVTLVLALREELKNTDITVNAVMPTAIDTWRTRKMPDAEPDKWVKPSDIAELLCCLCSNECDALSGSILKLPGKL